MPNGGIAIWILHFVYEESAESLYFSQNQKYLEHNNYAIYYCHRFSTK